LLLDNSLAARIVLVSDDAQLRSLLCGLLVAHGYHGVVGVDSQTALKAERLRAEWDVAIVDVVSVPSFGAMHALRALQATNAAVVVIVPKKNGDATPHGLAAGGHVVLGKPFDPRELLLIIRGMLEDNADAEEPSDAPVAVGPISLSPLLNAATVAAREIELTDVETRILHELLLNATQPVTRERLTRRALLRNWSPDDRALDTHINRLRRKLGVDQRGRTPIRTITGIGYLLLADWKPA
jgi:two-component system response regulator CpxR